MPDDGPDGVAQLELVGVGGGGKVLAELGHDGVEVLVARVVVPARRPHGGGQAGQEVEGALALHGEGGHQLF